jgi:azurin
MKKFPFRYLIGKIGITALLISITAFLLAASLYKDAQVTTIDMEIMDGMKFSKTLFGAKAGQKLVINIEDKEEHSHNIVFGKPGTLEKLGALADSLTADPDGWKTGWVPNTPDVIAKSPLLNEGDTYKMEFTVPDTPGDYPFLCTFPKHWQRMNGIMRVTK